MPEDNPDKWYKLPKVQLDRRKLARRVRKAEGATVRHAHRFIIRRWTNAQDVLRHIVLWMVVVGLLITAAGLQLMWYRQDYKTAAPSIDGTYAEAVLGPVGTLHPLFASSSAEQSAAYLIFSRILTYDSSGTLSYDLAKSVSVSEDEKVYTVKIRPDAKWHDGQPLTAKDIVFTVGLMKQPSTRSTITGWRDVKVQFVDDTTVKFSLQFPYAAFRHALTFPVVPEHILGDVSASSQRENVFGRQPIGSGPFSFNLIQDVNSSTGYKIIHMSRNEDYYATKAKLARFQLHAYPDRDGIVEALNGGEVNAAADLSAVEIGQVNTARYNIIDVPIRSGLYALLNTESENLKDINLRRALRLATDTKAIRETLGAKTPALHLPFIASQVSGEGLPGAPEYNPTRAKELLNDAGWKLSGSSDIRQKDGNNLRLSVVTIKNSESERILEVLVGQWREVGVVADIQVVDPTDVSQDIAQNILSPRNFDVLIYQLNIGADPDVYAYWHSSQASSQGSNFSNYKNAISDDALVSARSRSDEALRDAKYITFARQWFEDVPAIGLYQLSLRYVYSAAAESIDSKAVLVSPVNRYSNVLNWSVGTRSVYKTP